MADDEQYEYLDASLLELLETEEQESDQSKEKERVPETPEPPKDKPRSFPLPTLRFNRLPFGHGKPRTEPPGVVGRKEEERSRRHAAARPIKSMRSPPRSRRGPPVAPSASRTRDEQSRTHQRSRTRRRTAAAAEMEEERRQQEKERADELVTEPSAAVVFNAPFLRAQTVQVRVTNRTVGRRRVAWVFKSTNVKRFHVRPTIGQLNWGESVVLEMTCQPISGDYATEARRSRADRVTIEWLELAADSARVPLFRMSSAWFAKAGKKWRRPLKVTYNL